MTWARTSHKEHRCLRGTGGAGRGREERELVEQEGLLIGRTLWALTNQRETRLSLLVRARAGGKGFMTRQVQLGRGAMSARARWGVSEVVDRVVPKAQVATGA